MRAIGCWLVVACVCGCAAQRATPPDAEAVDAGGPGRGEASVGVLDAGVLPRDQGRPSYGETLPFVVLESGNQPRTFSTPFVRVAGDAAAWEALYRELWPPTGERLPPLPSVDFDTHVVVGVGLGLRPNTLYRVAILTVGVLSDAIEVLYEEQTPGHHCSAAMAVVLPYVLVKLPRRALPVRFRHLVRRAVACAPADACAQRRHAVEDELEVLRRCHVGTDCAPAAFRWPFCPGVWNPAQQSGRFDALAAAYCALPGCEWPCGYSSCAALRPGGRLACIGGRCEYLCSSLEGTSCQ